MDWKEQAAELERILPDCEVRVQWRIRETVKPLLPPRNTTAVEKKLNHCLKEAHASKNRCARILDTLPELSFPGELPITRHRADIRRAIQENQVVVVAGETGSGKTTQLPKFCLDAGLGVRGKIACTQPRRIAALSVSQRVAEELQVNWGGEVGAKIRFTDKTSEETRIKFLTDGMLLSEIHGDRHLLEYDAIIIDEAHERSLNIDFLLGYLNQLRKERTDLKIIITSATIDTESFSRAFDGAPVIEVSGRMFPVEVEYRPLEEWLPGGEGNYIDAAVAAVDELIRESQRGDILVFFPAERDIREARDSLTGRRWKRVDILTLFGRLSAGDQQKVFGRTPDRKVILSTNIAETSLTIPGIRYVVDTGYVRLSRYSSATRTQRLPIEPVSQSSANQRKGRCGRVENGICIRLYSESDYNKRPEYTQAEILRSNLAAVILRMKAFDLGEIERFPFIDPPGPRAIASGYQLLVELGALKTGKDKGASHELTELGWQLAHLPVDPTVGRMILEAKKEGAMEEVLIIAAGLSIQDPRERPEEKREEADQIHGKFQDKTSDFLTLYNIWAAYHERTGQLTQNQLRKFCKSHFLSYLRMREWRDIHQQLVLVMKDLRQFEKSGTGVDYAAIHRSITAGLLSNVALKDTGNHYRAARNRKVMIFPGSALFDKKASREMRKKKAGGQAREIIEGNTPDWMVASEIVETGQVYARTVAGILPEWLPGLGGHLLRYRYTDPAWDEKGERVMVRRRSILLGLEVEVKRIGYVEINAEEATEIFIREGLVGDGIRTQLKFLNHNRKVLADIEQKQARSRTYGFFGLEEALVRFYSRRLQKIGSVHDLKAWLKTHAEEGLVVSEEELMDDSSIEVDLQAFPGSLPTPEGERSIHYRYKPGEADDGATLKIPMHAFEAFKPGSLDWVVPGYLEEKVDALLRALPKDVRRRLFPIGEKAREIMEILKPGDYSLGEALSVIVQEKYGVGIPSAFWDYSAIPDHLKVRLEIVNDKDEPIASARSIEAISSEVRQRIRQAEQRHRNEQKDGDAWAAAQAQWGKKNLTEWNFGDLPERVEVSAFGSVPVYGYPGLTRGEQGCDLRLFKSLAEADRATRTALPVLLGEVLRYELAWLQKDLRDLKKLAPLCVTFLSQKSLLSHAYAHLCRHLFRSATVLPLKQKSFETLVLRIRGELKGLVPEFGDLLETIFKERQRFIVEKRGFPGMADDLRRLVPENFLLSTPYLQLKEYPRYLKAMRIRRERYLNDPQKDLKRADQLRPYKTQYLQWLEKPDLPPACAGPLRQLRWLLEEFKVSLFAQELGTSIPVSQKKVEDFIETIKLPEHPTTFAKKEKAKPAIDFKNLRIGREF